MKCKVCGAESGKYPLCRACNLKKEKGEIIKCNQCGNWHFMNIPCPVPTPVTETEAYLYDIKKTLISKSEQGFYTAIKASVPEGYCVFPQINLASFINRTDDARFHNELFRNVDFLITDDEYHPKFIIEINDQTHLNSERKERDMKVQRICEEAGIPILKLWTSYGVNEEYIKGRIHDTLSKLPVTRIHHFSQTPVPEQTFAGDIPSNPVMNISQSASRKKGGCYVATCVYGSYNCPEVWVLRRFRDEVLSEKVLGRTFVKVYYAISPTLIKWFGKYSWFVDSCKSILDKAVTKLQENGFDNTPYEDK